MKKVAKIITYVVIFAVVLVIAGASYVTLALPNVGEPENIKVDITPQRVAHGKYLATSVLLCVDCHSRRNAALFAGPIDTNMLGIGGDKFTANEGFPGDVTVPNITPYNLKDWTDGELFRAITTGQRKNGSAIFPLMPWPYYSKLDKEDIYDVIAYIRTLKPIKADYPKSSLDFPLNILVHTMPQKATLGKRPDPKDSVRYGEYLVQSAACQECHSQDNKGELIAGLQFGGGKEFVANGHKIHSANISPDMTTGIGSWSKQAFIARFKAFNDASKARPVGKDEFQTIMPWYNYARMSEGDLSSIYAYLRTVKPVKNNVVKFVAN
jgi:hypothetical protein